MKTLLPCLLAVLAVSLAAPAAAEVILYKGTVKVTYTGQNQTMKLSFKAFLVVDHDTADVAELLYASVSGTKFYSTGFLTNQHIVEVTGARLKQYSALTRPASDCDIADGLTGEAVVLQGANSLLAVGTNTTISFPKTLTSVEQGYSEDSGPASLINGTLTASFDKNRTIASNTAGDTLDSAFDKLVAYVQSLGYTEAAGEASKALTTAMRRAVLLQPEETAP
jgi:hypothetical protein